jgi:hypothetical protein
MYNNIIDNYIIASSLFFTLYLIYKFGKYLIMVYNYHNAEIDRKEKMLMSMEKTIENLDKSLNLISQRILIQNQIEEQNKK